MVQLLGYLDTSTLGLFDFDCTLLGTAFIILMGEFIYGKVVLVTKTSFSRNQSFVRTLMFTPYNRSLLTLRTGWDAITTFVSNKFRYGLKAIVTHSLLSNQASEMLKSKTFHSTSFMNSTVELELKHSTVHKNN